MALRAAKTAISRGSETDLDTGLEIEKLCYAQVICLNLMLRTVQTKCAS